MFFSIQGCFSFEFSGLEGFARNIAPLWNLLWGIWAGWYKYPSALLRICRTAFALCNDCIVLVAYGVIFDIGQIRLGMVSYGGES